MLDCCRAAFFSFSFIRADVEFIKRERKAKPESGINFGFLSIIYKSKSHLL